MSDENQPVQMLSPSGALNAVNGMPSASSIVNTNFELAVHAAPPLPREMVLPHSGRSEQTLWLRPPPPLPPLMNPSQMFPRIPLFSCLVGHPMMLGRPLTSPYGLPHPPGVTQTLLLPPRPYYGPPYLPRGFPSPLFCSVTVLRPPISPTRELMLTPTYSAPLKITEDIGKNSGATPGSQPISNRVCDPAQSLKGVPKRREEQVHKRC